MVRPERQRSRRGPPRDGRERGLSPEPVNGARYRPGQREGHYESFFQRANHPSRPLAFWIRYTIFSPEGRPEQAEGELWGVWFDGETGRHVAVKQEHPIRLCRFDPAALGVEIGGSRLGPGVLEGSAASGGHAISWRLRFSGREPPLLLLARRLYASRLPKAKSLVGLPLACYDGRLEVDGEPVEVAGWVGSQNHNWGRRHTDRYAWGQVAGFDGHPSSFLEVATARIKLGPLLTPPMTSLVLRHGGEEIALNRLRHMLRASGRLRFFRWDFRSEDERFRVSGTIEAPREAFVGLAYRNPPGGVKYCLNSKIASCELRFVDWRRGSRATSQILATRSRAAFEILTDEGGHGVEIRA